MSLEDKIQENTKAIDALREVIQEAMRMAPPAPMVPPTPAPTPAPEPEPEPEPEPVPTPVKPAQPEPPKEPEPKPEPKQEPEVKKEEPAPAMSPAELKKALKPKIQDLFVRNRDLGERILHEFNVTKLSEISDDQLPSFSKRVDTALQGI